MKIKIQPEHASMLPVNDWLTGLRDGESARPADPRNAEPRGPGYAEPAPARTAGPARTARIPAVPGVGTARGAALPSSRHPGRVGRGYPPLIRAELEWHHDYPADESQPRWQISGKPGRYIQSLAAALNPARVWRAYGGRRAAPRRDSGHSADLMVWERARAWSAGATNSTRR